MADYFGHWLRMGTLVGKPPAVFHVNWFRQDAGGNFMWPGFGQNLRVLLWMIERIEGRAQAQETPIGLVPAPGALNLDGLGLDEATIDTLLKVDRDEWAEEVPEIRAFFDRFGERLPPELNRSLDGLAQRLGVTASA
jgi:phosphoenolpyruvate carboxykinase (GTP)